MTLKLEKCWQIDFVAFNHGFHFRKFRISLKSQNARISLKSQYSSFCANSNATDVHANAMKLV